MKPISVFANLPMLGAILGLSLPMIALSGTTALSQTVFTQRQIIMQLQQPRLDHDEFEAYVDHVMRTLIPAE